MTDHDHDRLTAEDREALPMWRYTTWAGNKATVVADSIEFTAAFVIWRDRDGRVVLAEEVRNVGRLVDVAALGSTTRGTR